jgi:hypothetical protein
MSSTAETMGRLAARTRRRPSKAWYWVAAAIVLLGVSTGVAWGALTTLRTHERAQDLPRTGLPGRLEVRAVGGTSTLIFFEGEGKPSPEDLGLTVTGPDGSPVTVRPYDLGMEYEIAGCTGTPVASFSASSAGTYTVTAQKPSGAGAISVGDNFVRAQAVNIVGALALIAASITLGLVIVAVAIVKRSQHVGMPETP